MYIFGNENNTFQTISVGREVGAVANFGSVLFQKARSRPLTIELLYCQTQQCVHKIFGANLHKTHIFTAAGLYISSISYYVSPLSSLLPSPPVMLFFFIFNGLRTLFMRFRVYILSFFFLLCRCDASKKMFLPIPLIYSSLRE